MANVKASLNLEALPTPRSLAQTLPSDAVLDALKMILLGASLNEVLTTITRLIEAHSTGMLCSIFDSAEQFLNSAARHTAACLIADIRMPSMSGIELQANLKTERCRIPIIFITGRDDIPLAVRAMKEGASDFFTKPVDGAALLCSVERALQQNLVNHREAAERAFLVARYESLTPREREVLPLLASGLLNKQVAFELGITEWTVQLHRGHIMRKMQADSFAGLVRMADKLSPDPHPHLQVQFAS